jgi:hypothetical protein
MYLVNGQPLLTPDLVQIMRDGIDDIIQSFGRDCQLVFPGTGIVQCNNCVWDSMTRKSRNIYRTGGPIPFGQGSVCPVCGGKGTITQPEQYKTIHMVLRWNPSDFVLLPGNIEVPFSIVETEGWIRDLPAVLQSRVMIAEIPLAPIIRARFELSGEPVDTNSISEGQTFTAHWKRRG